MTPAGEAILHHRKGVMTVEQIFSIWFEGVIYHVVCGSRICNRQMFFLEEEHVDV